MAASDPYDAIFAIAEFFVVKNLVVKMCVLSNHLAVKSAVRGTVDLDDFFGLVEFARKKDRFLR